MNLRNMATIAVAVILSASAYVMAPVTAPLPSQAHVAQQAVVCEEDQPCWDCETMGNQICGSSDPDALIAWETFDEVGGSRSLIVEEPSRPFRVDYMGSTPDYPENTDSRDLILLGKDYKWHIFRATYTDVPEETGNIAEPADRS